MEPESTGDQFDDFTYWRPPLPDLSAVGLDTTTSHQAVVNEFNHQQVDEQDEYDEYDDEEEYDIVEPEEPLSSLLTGDAGNRLLGILGRLSQHLGENSRFARAASVLQGDVLSVRLQQQQQQDDAESRGRFEPAEGSTLAQPEVMSSVGSLLTMLNDPGHAHLSPERAIEHAEQTRPAPAPLRLFDLQMHDAAMPPPSPASPQALASLSPPRCPTFGLDEALTSCPICLEAIDDATEALEMPCTASAANIATSVSHVFHKECLLKWLGTRATCPVCRYAVPSQDEVELDAAAAAATTMDLVVDAVVDQVDGASAESLGPAQGA